MFKAESSAKHCEREAKDRATCVIQAKKERDEAKQEARVPQFVVASAGDAKVRAKVDLTTALNSLATAEECERRSEVEATRLAAKLAQLETERASLLLDLVASKGEVSSLHARVDKDKEDIVKDY